MRRPVAAPAPAAKLPAAIVVLAARGMRRKYRKGTIVVQEGDSGDALFIVLAGRFKIYSVDPGGKEITYNVLGPGEYFGEMALDGGIRSASAITLEAAECVMVTSDVLRAYSREDPDFAYSMLLTVIRRAREATAIARGLALGDVYTRLVAYLKKTSRATENEVRVVEPRLTHLELASRIGASREMVSRILKDLERGGYIEVVGKRLSILKNLPAHW